MRTLAQFKIFLKSCDNKSIMNGASADQSEIDPFFHSRFLAHFVSKRAIFKAVPFEKKYIDGLVLTLFEAAVNDEERGRKACINVNRGKKQVPILPLITCQIYFVANDILLASLTCEKRSQNEQIVSY